LNEGILPVPAGSPEMLIDGKRITTSVTRGQTIPFIPILHFSKAYDEGNLFMFSLNAWVLMDSRAWI
jgi:hypothetical protein